MIRLVSRGVLQLSSVLVGDNSVTNVKRWLLSCLGQYMVYALLNLELHYTFVQALDLPTWAVCSLLLLGPLNVQYFH